MARAMITDRQLAAMVYRTIHAGESPVWARDPDPGFQYKDGVKEERELYETIVTALRKTDPHRETVAPPGTITMDQARDMASTYHGGEGTHPLARHRDSMG